jgi:two-component system, cell cycle response regulator CtrA
MRVLLVEDDVALAKSIELMLKAEGYIVDVTDLGEDGLEIGKLYDYDIILLDLMLPDIDGYEVLRRLRSARVETPILILSGLTEMDHKLKGLGFGADDYLTKPFDRRELFARLQAIVRRSKGHAQSIIRTGKLVVNLDTRSVEVSSQPLHLTGKEYGILELLSLRKGTTLTKEMFLNHLYGGIDEPELKIIDVFVCKLRKKLTQCTGGDNYIETVWGRGYVLRDPIAPPLGEGAGATASERTRIGGTSEAAVGKPAKTGEPALVR